MSSRAASDDDAQAGPWNTDVLYGHSEAEQLLLNAFNSGRMPHAWMICGPRGIGKSTLAYRFARFVLSQGGEADSGLFGDATVVERQYAGRGRDAPLVNRFQFAHVILISQS